MILLNIKDTNKFYMFLPLYKSILFKFTKFQLMNDNIEIRQIIEGLNIKNRKRRIEYIYDDACKIIDEVNQNMNICGFKNNQCYVQRWNKSNYKCGSCRKCRYQSNTGCTTSNLACKL